MPTNFNPYHLTQQQLIGPIQGKAQQSMAATQQYLAQKYGTPQMGGAGSGLGNFAGQAQGAIGAAAGLFGQFNSMQNDWKNLQFANPTQQTDMYGKPIYSGAGLFNQVNTFKPQGATGSEIGGAVLQGAAGGAAFGPIGAGVGAVVGLASSVFGGRRRKRKQRQKLNEAKQRLEYSQNEFNDQAGQYEQDQNAADYYNQLNNNYGQRVNNLYG